MIILPNGQINAADKAAVAVRTPEMVDKFGTKWYLDKEGSTYASARDQTGTTLGDGATVWLLEELNGTFKIVLVIDNTVVFEGFSVQEVGNEITKLRALKAAGRRFK